MSSTTLTIRVPESEKDRLDSLAKSTGRSRSFLAAEAISAYLENNEWQIEGIKKAIAQADRGETIPHENVKKWIMSLGTKNELPKPKPRRQ